MKTGKTLVRVFLVAIILKFNMVNGETIHTDPMDIRKTCIGGGAIEAPFFGSGIFIFVNQYVSNKTMFYLNWYQFRDNPKGSSFSGIEPKLTFDSEQSPRFFNIRSFGIERHIFEKVNPAYINVILKNGYANRSSYYDNTVSINVPSFRRYSLAMVGGFVVMGGRQLIYRKSGYNREFKHLIKRSTGTKVDITDEKGDSYGTNVYTKSSITSLELGLKGKIITATGVTNENNCRRWSDIYFEYYLTFVVPLVSKYDNILYRGDNRDVSYKLNNVNKPKPGLRFGANLRRSVRSGPNIGLEASYLPSQFVGNDLFLVGRLGININVWKLKLTKEDSSEPAEEEKEEE